MHAAPVRTVGLRRGERGRTRGAESPPPRLPAHLPVSSRASSCNPWVPLPMPPRSLLPSPRRLLMVVACQCRRGAYLSKARGGVEGGRRWHCRLGAAFGLVVVGFGVATGFGTSKVVGVRLWGCLGGLSLVLGYRWLLRGGGWRFDGFGGVCMLTWHGCGWRRRRGVVSVDFAAIGLGWGGDVAREWVVGGGQAMGNGAGCGWGLPSRVWG